MLYGKHFLWIFFGFFVLNKGSCLVFLQSTATVNLPYDFPVGATFFRLHPINESTGEQVEEGLIYHVLRSVAFPQEAKSGRGLFTVDEHTGSLMLSPHRKHSLKEYKGSSFALDVVAVSLLQPTDNTTHGTVIIKVINESIANPKCEMAESVCFSTKEIQLHIPESVAEESSMGSVRPIPYQKLCPGLEVKYQLEPNDFLVISESGGKLKTSGLVDFEKQNMYEFNITCNLNDGNSSQSFQSKLQVYVLDVDDNAPFVQNEKSLEQEVDISQVIPGKPLPVQLNVLDADSAAVNNITVTLDDPLSLFRLKDPVVFLGVNGTYMFISAVIVPKSPFYFPKYFYNVSVVFSDNSLISSEKDNDVVFQIKISNHSASVVPHQLETQDFQIVTKTYRHSSRHARIVQPMQVKPHEGYFFRLLGEPDGGLMGSRIFGVTPNTGIVFVRDEVALARSSEDLFELELTWRTRKEMDRMCTIKIRILDTGDPSTVCGVEPGHRFPTCALHATAKSCTSSCGRGAADGFCRWREHDPPSSLSSQYATCSPHLETCPDGVCDELEQMDPTICPQDCAENIQGEAIQGPTGRGIGLSAAPCTCISPTTCVCMRFTSRSHQARHADPITEKKLVPQSKFSVKDSVFNTISPSEALEYDKEWDTCGFACRAMITVVSFVVAGLVVTAALIVYSRNARAKNQELVNVTTPLNPVRTPKEDNKRDGDLLEFPRSRLSLEETLGEGEFGRVVKGKAWDIAGTPGVTTVAVKMLKEGGSITEKCDLLMELNLLKDISHPNVVRLLGACTDDDGPLYVIMEYAKYGSLITYLRKMRAKYPQVQGEVRELISFAWQIAKGMEYLAGMKVVHRDLAARNVLVSEGKMMKISDFGLSRDVYEKDAYLKKTKGRVPYKWMALESLQNQIYTTKTDVWSFGILLWEIMTLGGCPYPGIPSENLYRLLKEGYRMPRPDDCPIQMYQLMTICWREKPNERPQFKDLVRKLEFLLNDSMHYLPMKDDSEVHLNKHVRTEEPVVMTQVTFPKLATVALGPYENRRLLSPTEYSV